MAFRVEITKEAERDATSILDWLISQQAGETGLRWFEGLEKAIASLANMPERCPLAIVCLRIKQRVRYRTC